MPETTAGGKRSPRPLPERRSAPARLNRGPDLRVRRERIGEQMISRIRDYMIEHSLSEGDRLPTEMEMARMFGASRISVREATKALGFLGILRSAPKRGVTVGRVDMERVTEYLSFHFALNSYPKEQLLKTRIALEIGALSEAMERVAGDARVSADLVGMTDRMASARSTDAFIRQDIAFHRKLLELSGIEPLLAFGELLEIFFQRFRGHVMQNRRAWSSGIESHREILRALRKRDLEAAERLLRLHMQHYHGEVAEA